MKHSSVLVLALLWSTLQAQVRLTNLNYYTVDGNVFILEEKGKPLIIEEAWQYYVQNKFIPIATPGNDINLGFVKHFYWIAIPVEPGTGTDGITTVVTGAVCRAVVLATLVPAGFTVTTF